jgi:acetylornithine deacetylase
MSDKSVNELYSEAVQLLKELIAIPSFSKEEQGTAALLHTFLQGKGIPAKKLMNNVWTCNLHFDPAKPTLLLNSHHDTVRPNAGYTKDPFKPVEQEGKLYGLGSNDAGASLVALLATFLHFYDRTDMQYNFVLAASAEEEISGKNGIEGLLPELGKITAAIVGEPTEMNMAVAEKGLMVLDCVAHGIAGHAARDEGENAIYKAMQDIAWFNTYRFGNVSELLGPVKMSVTMIQAGQQHNVVPAQCGFTVDVRLNECYANTEVLDIVRNNVACEVTPRSLRLNSTAISAEHPLVKAGQQLGLQAFGSSTLSDKALMPFPALKIGPGDSARSHTADEFIYLSEIEHGINIYINLLNQVL